jgi:hypothetical protein
MEGRFDMSISVRSETTIVKGADWKSPEFLPPRGSAQSVVEESSVGPRV